MKRFVTATVLLLGLANNGIAQQQTTDLHQHTAPPPGARYEVIQSELAAKWTFRLDRFTGHVAQFVTTTDGDSAWEDMSILDLPTAATPLHPRFQLFVSGLAARFTFLIDTDTGKSWVIVTGRRKNTDGTEYEVHSWQPFAGER